MRLHYGSTVATNALLERRGARVVLLTTAGFEDVLEIGRQTRQVLYALEPWRPEPLVPRRRRLGVRERVLVDGTVAVPLTDSALRVAVRRVRRTRAEAVAVCLLHAYRNPVHERRLAAALAPLGIHLSVSHRLLREYREYERTATTVVNAYVGPLMARHLRRLAGAVGGGLRVMQSNGGLVSAATASAEPVRTVLSGPAGGLVGAVRRAGAAGIGRVVTLDMGGTSTDVALVDGRLRWRTETLAGGIPVRLPTLDIHTVGAGGGSLARLDAGGALRVGPESAGAVPGPACYGRGSAPTVTDAHLVLGRLVESEFLGGRFPLDVGRARRALAPIARALGGGIEQAATGILAVVTAAMARAVRVITVERGYDPRDFTLVAFGGAGGLHAADLATSLGMRRVFVPRHPGLLSAWGMVGAEVVRDVSRTLRRVEPSADLLARGFRQLVHEMRRLLAREGVVRPRIETTLDARYLGQSYEIALPWRRGWVGAFHRAHERLYGHSHVGRPIEVVTLRVRARGGAGRLPVERLPAGGRPEPCHRRPVLFESGRVRSTPVFRRDELPAGWASRGPAIICEYSATTVVPPGWRVGVEPTGGLLLEAARG